VQRDRDRILHVEEVARLLAVVNAGPVALEQLHRPLGRNLFVGFRDHAAHVALVIFVGTVDVEELQPHDAIEDAFAPRPQIEELLRVAVHVQRREAVGIEVFAQIRFARTVGCRRRRVDEARVASERPRREVLRRAIVVGDQIRRVALGRGRARAEMVDLGDRAEGVRVLRDARIEFFGFEIFGEAQRHEVAPLIAAAEAVDDDRVLNPMTVEFPNQSAADQTGSTGHNSPARA